MRTPQPAIFVEEVALHCHLEFTIKPGVSDEAVRSAVTRARQAANTLRGPNIVWSFNPALWSEWEPNEVPPNVKPFEGIQGPVFTAPSTQADVWVWIQGNIWEKVWRAAQDVTDSLENDMDLSRQLRAYTAADNRDPTGFTDGTENPAVDEGIEISVVPPGNPGSGGVPMFIQKYIHNLTAFNELSVADQERVFGRTKEDSVQLPDDQMPETSHVSRNTIHDSDGNERHIYRRNTQFAKATEAGSLFIGCAAETDRIDIMLDRMFGVGADGNVIDSFLHYSTPVTGAYYWAPAMQSLEAVLGPLDPGDPDDDATEDVLTLSTDPAAQSLDIGSLK